MSDPTVYTVLARRWAHGWELHINDGAGEEIGVTQTRALSGAVAMVSDYLELDERPAPYVIHVVPELDAALRERVVAARTAVRRAAEEQERAATASRTAVEELKAAGLSGYEIAAVLEVSPQRVSQLSKRAPNKKERSTKVAAKKTDAKNAARLPKPRGSKEDLSSRAVSGRFYATRQEARDAAAAALRATYADLKRERDGRPAGR